MGETIWQPMCYRFAFLWRAVNLAKASGTVKCSLDALHVVWFDLITHSDEAKMEETVRFEFLQTEVNQKICIESDLAFPIFVKKLQELLTLLINFSKY